MAEFLKRIQQIGHSIVYGQPSPLSSLEIMASSSIREAAKQGQPFDRNLISELGKDSAYSIAVPYFAFKLLDGQAELQQELLRRLVTGHFDTQNSRSLSDTAVEFINNLPEGVGVPVSPNKLSRLQLWTPSLVHERAETVIQRAVDKRETPALVAYSGLFALQEALNHLQHVDHLLILFPKYSGQSLGFWVSNENTHIEVRPTSEEDIRNEKTIALIDDAVYSGKTSQDIKERFSSTQFEDNPLFVINK